MEGRHWGSDGLHLLANVGQWGGRRVMLANVGHLTLPIWGSAWVRFEGVWLSLACFLEGFHDSLGLGDALPVGGF